jgi:uroporphyrinogen-III synthase
MRRVIVLRPEPAASETVARAVRRGLDARSIPLFEIEPLQWQPPDAEQFDALLVTSANAVRFAGPALRELRSLPVYAVGEASAAAARDAGFAVAAGGDNGVEDLVGGIDPRLRLLHLAGEHRSAMSRPAVVVPVYRARLINAPGHMREAEGAVVLVHSPRAGRAFADAADRLQLHRASIKIAAISAAAAEAAGEGWVAVEFATQPTDDALLALAERLCDKDGAE